jgi:hypothetical protein
MEKQTADAVVQRPDDALRRAVLRGGIRAGKAKSNAMVFKMMAKSNVIKLLAIVRLKSNERELESSLNISMKHK